MESKVSRYQSKTNRLLEKLLESKCEIEIEGHLNKLLVTFSQQQAKGQCSVINNTRNGSLF
jgi:hypothetical protein